MTQRVKSLQNRYAPDLECFGCGPKNTQGLKIESYVALENPELLKALPFTLTTLSQPMESLRIIAFFRPQTHHQAFPGILCGGIIGSILDCHCNWCATHALMKTKNLSSPPCSVTAQYTIKLLRPTPMPTSLDKELVLEAYPLEILEDRVVVEGKLWIPSQNKVGATCQGTFVAVKEGHPAFHRW